MDRLSSGAKRDLLVVSFAHAMLVTAETPNQVGVVSLPNSKHTQRIRRRAKALRETLHSIYYGNTSKTDHKWFKNKLDSKMLPLLMKIQNNNVELTSFAIYLIYINFNDNRQLKLDDIFEPLLDADKSFDTLDLIEEVLSDDATSAMYEIARYSVPHLKS